MGSVLQLAKSMERFSVPERRSPSSVLTFFLVELVPGPWFLWQEAQPEGSPGLGNGLQDSAVVQRGALTVELTGAQSLAVLCEAGDSYCP